MENDANTLRAQLRHRHNQIVRRPDIRLIGLVHVESGGFGAEEGGDDEVEFAIRETIATCQTRSILPPTAQPNQVSGLR